MVGDHGNAVTDIMQNSVFQASTKGPGAAILEALPSATNSTGAPGTSDQTGKANVPTLPVLLS